MFIWWLCYEKPVNTELKLIYTELLNKIFEIELFSFWINDFVLTQKWCLENIAYSTNIKIVVCKKLSTETLVKLSSSNLVIIGPNV